MRIAIVGAGMGGLTAASLLADRGHAITVFDRFKTPRPVGSGLVIQPVGQMVLAQVGALERALALGTPITRMHGVEARSGRRVLDVRYDLNDPRAFGLGIHRAALFEVLLGALVERGIALRTGHAVTGLVRDGDRVSLLAENHRAGPFDLVVDAAGVNSPLSPLEARKLGFGAIWGTVDWPATDLPRDMLAQRYRRANRMLGLLPLGADKATIFWSLPSNGYEDWKDAGLPAWRTEATALWPALAPFLDQITEPSQMTMARYSHGTLKRPYSKRLVHIGDAAHRASPQLGQGANMALLDALALARALDRHPVDRAFPAYARARRWHTAIYQAMSWAFTPMYQSHSRILPILRDRVLFPVSQVPPAPCILTSLVCGTMVRPTGRL